MSFLDFLFGKKNLSLDCYPEALIIFTDEMKVVRLNDYARKLLQLENSNTDKIVVDDLFDCDFNILLKELLQENNICTLKLKDTEVYVEIKASKNKKQEVCFSMRDVTQKHKTITSFMNEYETSKKVNRTKNNLLVKLDNELTAPLHSITGFSQAMLEGLSGKIDAKQKKYLDIINKNAFDLLELVEQLIEGAKLESGLYEFDMKNFDVVDMMSSILTDFAQQCPNIKTSTDFSKLERRSIYTDENVLKKIIQYFIASLVKETEYNEIAVVIESPDIDFVKENGFAVDEQTLPKSFVHVSINSNVDCPSTVSQDNVFEIYPQLEKNAKRDVIKNIPLYNASLLSKFLQIKISAKNSGKMGFDIIFNVDKA